MHYFLILYLSSLLISLTIHCLIQAFRFYYTSRRIISYGTVSYRLEIVMPKAWRLYWFNQKSVKTAANS